METFLRECGLEHAISTFSEHSIEMDNLNSLTESEIKELLPKIGHRHRLKNAIKRNATQGGKTPIKRMKDNSGNSGPTTSRENISQNIGTKRLQKNDEEKANFIKNILNTDDASKAQLIQMAQQIMDEFEPQLLVQKYHHSEFRFLDYDVGKLNCPLNKICKTKIAPQLRKTNPVKWMLPNYKRHLKEHLKDYRRKNQSSDSEDDVSCVTSFLQITMNSQVSDFDDEDAMADNDEVDESSQMEKIPNNKRKTGRPQMSKSNDQSFMLHRSHILYKHPTELAQIKTGSFLMRNMRKDTAATTRVRINRTIAEYELKIEKTGRVAGILREICEELSNYKEITGQYLLTKLNPPTKEKCPEYYEKIDMSIDLSTIASNVEQGVYKLPGSFDEDVSRLFSNVVKFYGLSSPEGVAAQELLRFYTMKKEDVYQRLLTIIGDKQLIKTFVTDKQSQLNVNPNEDIIQCICGLHREESDIIQCSGCKIWQHIECTGADIKADDYLCERCDKRTVDPEIPLKEYTKEGYRYFLTLMRGDLQVHQTDTVYLLRDIPITPDPDASTATTAVKKHTYKTIGKIEYTEFDIFRVERLWKDNDGNRFVYGHHYLRPYETYHEPTRKFYDNEIVRVPQYEVVPIDLVMGRCWVLDPKTFCKGRPVDCEESHVYICELRMDKAARLFSKISKQQYPVCTKSYAFNKFEQKLKISRNYVPRHIANVAPQKPKKKKSEDQCKFPQTLNEMRFIAKMVSLK